VGLCVAVCCSVLKCVAVCRSVLQNITACLASSNWTSNDSAEYVLGQVCVYGKREREKERETTGDHGCDKERGFAVVRDKGCGVCEMECHLPYPTLFVGS